MVAEFQLEASSEDSKISIVPEVRQYSSVLGVVLRKWIVYKVNKDIFTNTKFNLNQKSL